MSFTIRTAITENDWQQGLAVLHHVYVGEGHSPAERAAQTFRREVLEPEGAFLVAMKDKNCLGATILLHERSALGQIAQPGEREFRLLAVDGDARGGGVGEALVRECIERRKAQGAQALVLWTRPVMTAAQRLYERLGFARVTERDEQDQRGFTRMVYRLEL